MREAPLQPRRGGWRPAPMPAPRSGITVFTGMLASTCPAVLFVPSFFVMVQRFEEWQWRAGKGVVAED